MKDMPAANEVHEMIEEGARAIFQAGPTRVVTDDDEQGHRRRVPAHAPRASRMRPAGAGRSRWPAPSSSSSATACCWPSARGPSSTGWTRLGRGPARPSSAGSGGRGHLHDRPSRRVRHRRRAHRRRDGGPGQRRGPPRGVRHRRLPQGPGPRRHQDAPDAGRAAARVPVHRALHGRGQGAALPPQGDGRGGAQQELRRVRDPVHAAGGDGRSRALPPVHVRGDRLLRPAAPGHRVRHDAQDARAAAAQRVPATGA